MLMPRRLAVAMLFVAVSGTALARSEVGMNGFACSMYAELPKDNENLFLSPFSLSSALAMTAEGARGDRARKMSAVPGLGSTHKQADAERPYDWAWEHARLGQLADRLAPKVAPPALLKATD
ncbi:MAG: hypothetical protein IPF83_11715 [Rhodanobacteraceae bacterium]|nr:hypothetical protein [Rhodanobacteraceae bacterium]MBK7044764.1 hypothetical protein [Rhodanobacteraceae bacterium]HQW82063.1 serpin family protein [Pseudomonadota bacterium]